MPLHIQARRMKRSFEMDGAPLEVQLGVSAVCEGEEGGPSLRILVLFFMRKAFDGFQ